MQKWTTTARTLALCAIALSTLGGHCQAAQTARTDGAVTKSDVLSIQDGKFYLHGKRYVEFSFNKFDVFWQLWELLKDGKGDTQEYRDMAAKQDQSLRELHEMGLHGIRFFGAPWALVDFRPIFNDPAKRASIFYKAMDTALDLCDKNQIKVVYDMGTADFTDAQLTPTGWKQGEEQLKELMANPGSRSRQEAYRYVDEVVNHYKNRKTIMMWEVSNETTDSADIMPENNIYNGQRMPSLLDVAHFLNDVATRIKSDDPLRIVNNGGDHLRGCQWNQYTKHGWIRDTVDEQNKALDLLYAHNAIDVIDIHYGLNYQGVAEPVKGPDGKEASMNVARYVEAAKRIGKPLMLGEVAIQLVARDDTAASKKTYQETPDAVGSYWDPNAAKWVKAVCDEIVDAGPQLVFWWTYSSDRPQDQTEPSFFIKKGRTDAVLAVMMDANKRLKAKYGVKTSPD